MLLNDFDNVDKYLVNAESLFANLADLKKIDSEFGELSEDQLKIIRQFWVNFNAGGATREKNDFLGLWSILRELYINYRNSLREKGMAYEGMIFRDIAEKCINGDLPDFDFENFHFAGFNALNSCEKILMSSLKVKDQARFYWDYDDSTVLKDPKHSAGFFLRENLRKHANNGAGRPQAPRGFTGGGSGIGTTPATAWSSGICCAAISTFRSATS
jgi:hypothetical protein